MKKNPMEQANYPDFDPSFASPAEWAAMYRGLGLQVVPAKVAVRGGHWKMPALSKWTHLQEALAEQDLFDQWYGPASGERAGGEHITRQNMGILTGRCSGNVFVIDLDDQKGPQADEWWRDLLEVHNNRIEIETVEQRTGGGGRQKLFRAPPDWVAPTNRTAIGVDIRGQAGFAVMPASLHDSGQYYVWAAGRAPWETAIADAPEWLLEAVEELVATHGGSVVSFPQERTPSPVADFNAFGNRQDGREEYMRDLIWAAVLDLRRQCPTPPGQVERDAVWADYERNTRSRLPVAEGVSNADLLEREGRGFSLFANKWRRAIKKWDGKVAEEAGKPRPGEFIEAESQIDPATGQPLPLVLTAEQFVAGFTPPAYLIDGILQRGYLYSLTARTGHGKTAVTMYLAQCLARGEAMHGKEVKAGTVLVLAGENPDDIRARFLVLAEAYGFDAENIKMRFVAGVIDIAKQMPVIEAAAAEIADLVLVLVDTAAAYFPGDETNSNSQQGAYARGLRQLTFLPGKPAVLVNCHPIKNAAQDNLLPMGGSAFLNEVDGNLTLWADAEKQVTLHWLGKFRGPDFEPMSFDLRVAESARVHDADGRLMPSVVAVPIAEATLEEGRRKSETDENRVLRILAASPNASFSYIATRAGFEIEGRPSKTKVFRIMAVLMKFKLVEQRRNGKYKITEKGKEEIGMGVEI